MLSNLALVALIIQGVEVNEALSEPLTVWQLVLAGLASLLALAALAILSLATVWGISRGQNAMVRFFARRFGHTLPEEGKEGEDGSIGE